MSKINFDIKNVRLDFSALNVMPIYFDNAATTLKPTPVCAACDRYNCKESTNIHRAVYHLSEQNTTYFERTRQKVKEFINASKIEEIIFTKGTTESINLVANSYGELLNEGDEIIISEMEHHANIVPWQILAKKKRITVKAVKMTPCGELDWDHYQTLFTPRTRLVSLTYISNVLGTINPIQQFIDFAHQKGALFLLDAAQAMAHLPIDVQNLDCDFLVFSAHKIFGPTGVGVLYGKEKLLDQMPPYQGGGSMIDSVDLEAGTTFNMLPHKFEAGTPHIEGVIAFYESLSYLSRYSWEDLEAHYELLGKRLAQALSISPKITVYGSPAHRIATIPFNIEGLHAHDVGTFLNESGIAVRTGHHCAQPLMKFFGTSAMVRASLSIYNRIEEIEKFEEALLKIINTFT